MRSSLLGKKFKTSKIMAVQHNKWSHFEYEDHHYRVRLIDYGWSYTIFQIQKQTNTTRRKYFIFGELIPTWEHLASPYFDYFPYGTFIRRDFYYADWVKIWAVRAIEDVRHIIIHQHENKI
jgi:hypothetical protein